MKHVGVDTDISSETCGNFQDVFCAALDALQYREAHTAIAMFAGFHYAKLPSVKYGAAHESSHSHSLQTFIDPYHFFAAQLPLILALI